MNEVLPVISSKLPDLINSYIQTRAERLRVEADMEEKKAAEEELKKTIIAKMQEQGVNALGSDFGMVKLSINTEPVAENWIETWKYIQETGQFDLLHKRLANVAVKERWEAGMEIPGVGRQQVAKLTVSKTK